MEKYKQIIGDYKVKNSKLKELNQLANEKIKKLNHFKIKFVKRDKNKEADRMVNLALDRKQNGEIELATV